MNFSKHSCLEQLTVALGYKITKRHGGMEPFTSKRLKPRSTRQEKGGNLDPLHGLSSQEFEEDYTSQYLAVALAD